MKKRNAQGLLIDSEGNVLPQDQQQTLDEEKAELAAAGNQDDPEDDDSEDFSDPVKVKAEIKKLRAEAAKHRTKAKAFETQFNEANGKLGSLKKAFVGDDEQEDPVQVAKQLSESNQALQIELTISELAIDHEVPKAQKKYFKFLLSEKMESLEENDELTDEDIAEIAAQAKGAGGFQQGGGTKQNSTGLGSGNRQADKGGSAAITVEKFAKMTLNEKSELYGKNPTEYQRLFDAAKEAGLIK